jgi:hypothetical protein
MARRKLTVVEQAIKDAAVELGLPKDHWDVERLATLQVMLKAARHKWENGQSSGAASDMVTLMEEITKLRTAAGLASGPREIEVTYVRAVTGIYKCKHCGEENELEDGKYTPAPPPRVVDMPSDSVARATATTPAAPENTRVSGPENGAVAPSESKPAPDAPKVTHRDGVSASPFHSQVINGREVAPLKKYQPSPYTIRKISPMGG